MFEDLESMLNGGGAIAAVKTNHIHARVKNTNSRIVPMTDIDDLEDMYGENTKKPSNTLGPG